MKIVLCSPLFVRLNSLDYSYWNIYVPLTQLGHQVEYFDYTKHGSFKQWLSSRENPDLIFSIGTGHEGQEYYDTFKELLDSDINTVNLFCDDSWRYEDYSSKVYKNFKNVITTEMNFLDRYDGVNSLYMTWPVNGDLYDLHKSNRTNLLASYGGFTEYKSKLFGASIRPIVQPSTVFYEDIVSLLGRSKICVCSSDNRGRQQTKARVFEAAAAGCVILTEDYPDIDVHFSKTEIIKFSGPVMMNKIIEKLIEKPDLVEYFASNGSKAFKEKYEAKIVLSKILNRLQEE